MVSTIIIKERLNNSLIRKGLCLNQPPLFPHGRWLLCQPHHFDIIYEINPWMSTANKPASDAADRQWQDLHHTLLRLGAYVEYIMPHKDVPDIVYTANGGLVKGSKVVLSKFRYPERRLEEPYFERWFEDAGYEVLKITSEHSFEGEGDALFAGDTLFAGFPFRSDPEAHQEVKKLLGIRELVLCELTDPRFYHIDTSFCPLSEDEAIIFKQAFAPDSFERMSKKIKLHEVPQEEGERFVCNAVVLGKDIVLPDDCPRTYELLDSLGYTAHPVKMNEFMKGGGASKCLTLFLDRA